MYSKLNAESTTSQIIDVLGEVEVRSKALVIAGLRGNEPPKGVSPEFMAAVVGWNEISAVASGLSYLRASFAVAVDAEMDHLSMEALNGLQLCMEDARASIASAELHCHLAMKGICAFAATLPSAIEAAEDGDERSATMELLDTMLDAMQGPKEVPDAMHLMAISDAEDGDASEEPREAVH